jgi:hypothetical protein
VEEVQDSCYLHIQTQADSLAQQRDQADWITGRIDKGDGLIDMDNGLALIDLGALQAA